MKLQLHRSDKHTTDLNSRFRIYNWLLITVCYDGSIVEEHWIHERKERGRNLLKT